MSNIKEVKFAASPIEGATEKMNREMPALSGAFAAIAKARKAYYDAHIDAGFTQEQAMQMVRDFNHQSGAM